jgi:cell wall assembly regulator SMI1
MMALFCPLKEPLEHIIRTSTMMKKRNAHPAPSLALLWDTIDDWLEQHQKKQKLQLPPGASEGEIALAETALGIKFPKQIRDSHRIHNGSGAIALLPFGSWDLAYPLLPLLGMVGGWRVIQDSVRRGGYSGPAFVSNPKGPIKKTWFHLHWIPIMDNQCGDFYFLDLAPAKGGKRGQIIDFSREAGPAKVIASCFRDLLATLAAELKAGQYSFDEETTLLLATKRLMRPRQGGRR